jgi:hypothetical protein
MGLHSGPFRADLMSANHLRKFSCLSKLQLHTARSNLCRLPTTSRVDSQRQLQPTDPKTFGSSKGSWKKQNIHSEVERSHSYDKSSRPSGDASGGESHGHGDSSLGQKRKLPPHEQKKKDYCLKAKQ